MEELGDDDPRMNEYFYPRVEDQVEKKQMVDQVIADALEPIDTLIRASKFLEALRLANQAIAFVSVDPYSPPIYSVGSDDYCSPHPDDHEKLTQFKLEMLRDRLQKKLLNLYYS